MLCIPAPSYGHDYTAADVFFTTHTGSALGSGFLSHNIAMATAGAAWLAGGLVATHAGVVIGPGRGVEANGDGVQSVALDQYLGQREALLWVATPAGQTPAAVTALVDAALKAANRGVGYDYRLLLGMGLAGVNPGPDAHFWDDSGRVICSEFVGGLLLATEGLRAAALPPAFKAVHPSRMTPNWLWTQPVWAA